MSEFEITEETIKSPYFGIVYGPAGTGKTWLCKHAEKPFYIAAEKGVKNVPGVGKFIKNGDVQVPESTEEFFNMIRYFLKEEHPYKTIVIDSAMFLDKLFIHDVLAEESEKKKEINIEGKPKKEIASIGDLDYGKGYAKIVSLWEVRFFTALKYLCNKGINVILIAHSRPTNTVDNDGNEYKKHNLDVSTFGMYSVPNLLCARADWVLFMQSEIKTKKTLGGFDGRKVITRADAASPGDTIVYTRGTSGYFAKVNVEKVDNVQDEYIIDIRDESTSKKLFEDLTK